jgi:hypothetical protein
MTNEEIRQKLAEANRRIEALERCLAEVQGLLTRVQFRRPEPGGGSPYDLSDRHPPWVRRNGRE